MTTTKPQAVLFSGRVHIPGNRTVRNNAGQLRWVPICGSWTRRATMFPMAYEGNGEVDCMRCLAKTTRKDER